jgi:CheY-like chemotaxis protein
MNGWELLKAIRAIQPDIPVILASGYDEELIMTHNDTEQPQAFLHKPYQMKTLKEKLDQVLGGVKGDNS